ncbi:MAG: thioredoxin family protein [Gelidibacter sp.]
METTEEINIYDSINDSLEQSIPYSQYRTEVADLAANNATSGNEKTEALVNYTLLNDRRMKRWDKTIKVSDEVKRKVSNFEGNVTWLVLTESWCGDAAHVIPVINKIAELSQNIHLKLVYRDENEALMNQFLTNGSKSIPKLIMIDNRSGEVMDTFGPRPSEATQMVMDYKKKHGVLTPEFKEELQHWYNTDKGQNTIGDLLKLLNL